MYYIFEVADAKSMNTNTYGIKNTKRIERIEYSGFYRFDFLVGGSPALAGAGPDSALRFLAVRV